MATTKYTYDVLAPLVAEARSVADVLRALGLRPNGGSHAHISRRIRQLGIDASHFRPLTTGGHRPRLTAEQILRRSDALGRRQKPGLLRRAMLESGVAHRCAGCGNEGRWQGRRLVLEVDHIDGDFLNNSLCNLRFLCPNCHRLTENHAGRSRGRYTAASVVEGPSRL